jgi:lipopolysaccharide transport system ATP-binding protein
MSDTVLHADNLRKRYGLSPIRSLASTLSRRFVRSGDRQTRAPEFWALKGVSIDLKRGQTLGVIGSNGAWKSTLLKILCGVTNPTEGKLQLFGKAAPLIEVGAGFHPELSGRENIFFNAAIMGMTRQEIQRKFDAIVAFSELEDFLDVPVKKYSSGMFVRLGFSVAVHTEPDILLVDEVLSVGDAHFQRKSFDAIRSMMKQGCSLVIVSHSMTSIQSVCERVIWLDHGDVREDGDPDTVIANYCQESNRKYAESQQQTAGPTTSDPVRIERVVIRDALGEETDIVRSRSAITLEIHYHARDTIHRPFFWIGVAQGQHGNLLGFSNIAPENRPAFIRGSGVMRVRIPDVPLMPGVYQFSGGVRDETSAIPLTETRVLRTFQVGMTAPGRIGETEVTAALAFDYAPVIVPFEWLGDTPDNIASEACAVGTRG